MREGRDRKQLIKKSKKVPLERIRSFIYDENGIPWFFVLKTRHADIIRGWSPKGTGELAICDDVLAFAIAEYLKSQGLVFESDELAFDFAKAHFFRDVPVPSDAIQEDTSFPSSQ
ncbi:MAG: hypothetical protein ACR2FY_04170 [Pirellulaceae bacterium]